MMLRQKIDEQRRDIKCNREDQEEDGEEISEENTDRQILGANENEIA